MRGRQLMLSTLHQYFNLKAEIDMANYGQESKKHEIVAKLYMLLGKLTEDQKLTLLRLLLKDRMVDYLFKLVIDLSDNQRLILMKQLEQITSKGSHYDRRKYIRKDCLINAKLSVANRIFTCFILDISPHGAYIDTGVGIVVGQSVKIMFSSPNNRERLIFSGETVWCENQGAGIKFKHSKPNQIDVIKSFTENKQKIYEINSC
jgi:hypothetical protein